MRLRLLVIIADPEPSGISAALARAYGLAAQAHGAEVHYLDLKRMLFDPFHRDRSVAAGLGRAELADAQAALRWADHTVWSYPLSWSGMPAILQGFVDQVMVPGFAYLGTPADDSWKPLLAGKSADILVVVDSLPWYRRFGVHRAASRQLRESALEPSGIGPVRGHAFGPRVMANVARQSAWFAEVARLATSGLGLPMEESPFPPVVEEARVLSSPFGQLPPASQAMMFVPDPDTRTAEKKIAG